MFFGKDKENKGGSQEGSEESKQQRPFVEERLISIDNGFLSCLTGVINLSFVVAIFISYEKEIWNINCQRVNGDMCQIKFRTCEQAEKFFKDICQALQKDRPHKRPEMETSSRCC